MAISRQDNSEIYHDVTWCSMTYHGVVWDFTGFWRFLWSVRKISISIQNFGDSQFYFSFSPETTGQIMKGGMFISNKDIQLIENCSERTAQRIRNKIKRHFNKEGSKITIQEYAEFNEISKEEVTEFLLDNR